MDILHKGVENILVSHNRLNILKRNALDVVTDGSDDLTRYEDKAYQEVEMFREEIKRIKVHINIERCQYAASIIIHIMPFDTFID